MFKHYVINPLLISISKYQANNISTDINNGISNCDIMPSTPSSSTSTSSSSQNSNNDFFASSTFKLILLSAMVLQNSATVLLGRYTLAGVAVNDQYNVNHLIVVTEIGKLLLSLVFEHFGTNGELMKSIQENIIDRPKDALKIMIPALLYLVQNTLLYVALSNLTAPLFQVTYQTKLVTTAVVSVIMLNRKYSFQQWACLVTLSIGVAVVVLDQTSDNGSAADTDGQSIFKGLVAVSIACFSSALAGVYFEKVIKVPSHGGQVRKKPVSVWMRNIQLAFFTIITALLQNMFANGDARVHPETGAALPYLHGFTFWAWVMVCLQTSGGMLVAAVIKYADNVLKGLATGVSVCFATAVSFVFFGTPITGQFLAGASVILCSVYFFSNPIQSKNSIKNVDEILSMIPK